MEIRNNKGKKAICYDLRLAAYVRFRTAWRGGTALALVSGLRCISFTLRIHSIVHTITYSDIERSLSLCAR